MKIHPCMFYSTPKKERLCQRKFSDKHTIFFLQSGGCIQNSSINPPCLRARLGTPPAAAARPLPPRAPPRPPRRSPLGVWAAAAAAATPACIPCVALPLRSSQLLPAARASTCARMGELLAAPAAPTPACGAPPCSSCRRLLGVQQ